MGTVPYSMYVQAGYIYRYRSDEVNISRMVYPVHVPYTRYIPVKCDGILLVYQMECGIDPGCLLRVPVWRRWFGF